MKESLSLEQIDILGQSIMALFVVIGLIAVVLYSVGSIVGSMIKEKLRA